MYIWMKRFTILLLSVFLLSSCENRTIIDYSTLPKGTVLVGNMSDGMKLYLIREDAGKMAGICLIDSNQAIVEKMRFFADSTGVTTLIIENDVYAGEMQINPSSQEMKLSLPKIPVININPQTVHLTYFGKISESVACLERYKNPVFDSIIAANDIQYGTATGYYTSKPVDYISKDDYIHLFDEMYNTYKNNVIKQGMTELPLYFDFYHPENDTLNKRPLLLFIHGGAFFFGDKENKMQNALTAYFVKRGYVVASINYRLGSTLIGTAAIERSIYRNVQDTRAALRYLVAHKDSFRIDEKQIYLAGSSAGGIIALTTAFMDSDEVYSSIDEGQWWHIRSNLGGLDDSGNNIITGFNIAGVASFWGGVTDLKMLNNPVPTLMFHGKEDDIIPYDKGLPFKNFMGEVVLRFLSSTWKLYGSESIFNHLTALSIPAKYIPLHGSGHDPHIEPDGSLNPTMDIICDETCAFLYDNLSKQYFNYELSGKTSIEKSEPAPVYRLTNAENASVQWEVDGGFITDQTNSAIRVIWFSSHTTGTVTTCITNKQGVSCRKELTIQIN